MKIALLMLFLGASVNQAYAKLGDPTNDNFELRFASNWQAGIDPGIEIQAPREDSIKVVKKPEWHGASALQITLDFSDHFEGVANGSPRAEIDFSPIFRFEKDKKYRISWSMMLSTDFKFDTAQPEILAQIHQSSNLGSPPVALALRGGRYELEVRNAEHSPMRRIDLGGASEDRGRVVHWILTYRPDDSGTAGEVLVTKNGKLVGNCSEPCANAYANDNAAYLKLGIYKWWWHERPSDVSERIVYYGPLEVGEQR